jgi:prophage tail gpP-like protein
MRVRPGELTITSGELTIAGWTDIRVTRGIERLPSDFNIGMTELHRGEFDALALQPGGECQVLIDGDPVVTGYIDHFVPSFGAGDHSIRLAGRSMCADLVDCAAEWPGGQISNATVLGVAQKLASVYGPIVNGRATGIRVSTDVPRLPVLPQTNVMLGESPFEIIDRMARFSAVLAYDLPDGSLFLAQAGKNRAASGFAEGQNVQRAYIDYSANQTYSEYMVYRQSTDPFKAVDGQGNLITQVTDLNVRRHRQMVIISEGGSLGDEIAKLRGAWEAARRFGRSRIVRLITDSWRDVDGVLWSPNTLVPVHLPTLKLLNEEFLIAEVTFQKNDYSGTTAELMLMAPEAFVPQPINLTPLWGDVQTGASA